MTQKKRIIAGICMVLLLVGIVAGVTLAWLSDNDEVINTFTYENGDGSGDSPVKIEVREPNWSPDPGYQFTGGSPATDVGKPGSGITEYGEDTAERFLPGALIAKNPTVKHYGTINAFVGIRVSAPSGSTLTMAEMEQIFDIDWNIGTGANQWTEVTPTGSDARFFTYNGTLAPGGVASSLFTTVEVLNITSANEPIFDKITAVGKNTIQLQVKGYSVQAENDKMGSSWNALNALKSEFTTGQVKGVTDWNW